MKIFNLFKRKTNKEENKKEEKQNGVVVDEEYIKWKKEKDFKANVGKVEKLLKEHFQDEKNNGEKSFHYEPYWYFDTYHLAKWWTNCAEWRTYYETVLSKEYWFIKWLVNNNKIDLDMVREKLWIPCCVWYGSWRIIAVKDVEDYEQLLMLLSIQDNPIEFLLSILK